MTIERPEWDAPYAVWQRYCDELNQAVMTVETMEIGLGCIMREDRFPNQLVRYAQGFKGVSPDVATAAIRARYEIWSEAWQCGIDLKEQQSEVYKALATRPLTPEDFNVFPAFADAEA